MSTEQCRIGVKNLLSRFQVPLLPVQGNLVGSWMMNLNPEAHPLLYQCYHLLLLIDVPVHGNLVRRHKEYSKTFQKTFELVKLAMTLVLWEKFFLGNIFVPVHDIELAGFGYAGSCREYTSVHLGIFEEAQPKGWTRGQTIIGPVSEVTVTSYMELVGIENQDWLHAGEWISILDCDQHRVWQIRDGASRGERETYSLRISGLQCGETRCDKTEGTIHTITIIFILDDCHAKSGMTFLPLDTLMKKSFNVSKTMIRILRHRCIHSSRKRWSSGVEKIVTYVVSWAYPDAPRWMN